MDNLLEYLVPLIFAAIYFFGNMLSKKSDDDVAPGPRRGEEEDPDAVERQRNIQEEIRRKIMERRNQAEGSQSSESARQRPEPAARDRESPHSHRHEPHSHRQSPPTSAQPSESHSDRALRERRAAAEQRRQQREQDKQSTHPSSHPESRIPDPESQPHPDPAFSWDTNDNIYDTQIEDRLKKIELTRQKASELNRQVSQSRGKPSPEPRSSGRRRIARRPVRETLNDPAAARTAFIYGEVLGQPISQRKAPTVPGLVR